MTRSGWSALKLMGVGIYPLYPLKPLHSCSISYSTNPLGNEEPEEMGI